MIMSSTRYKRIAILSVHCLLLVAMAANGFTRTITCNGGYYVSGETAVVVCNLHANMTANKLNLTITRHKPSDGPGTDIVVCRWKETKQEHECDVQEKGYTFIGDIEDHPRIEIQSVNEQHAGLYMCSNVPSAGTQPHPCEIVLTENPIEWTKGLSRDGTQCDQKDQCVSLGYIAIPVVAFVLLAVTVVIFYFKRYRPEEFRRKHTTDGNSSSKPVYYAISQNESNEPSTSPQESVLLKKEVENFMKRFRLSAADRERVMELVAEHIKLRPAHDKATVQITCKFVKSLTDKSNIGATVVVGFSSTILTIVLVENEPNNKDAAFTTHRIPSDIKTKTSLQIFEFIADCINKFANAHIRESKLLLWFIVSFPCENESLTDVHLKKWTKEFECKNDVDLDLGDLLQKALQATNAELVVDIKVIVNNAVATLVSAAYQNDACMISLILSNGFNICYVRKKGEWLSMKGMEKGNPTVGIDPAQWKKQINDSFMIRRLSKNSNGKYFMLMAIQEIVNTELGALGENQCLEMLRTDFDKDVDRHSVHPGEQILEKMIGRKYITEIVLVVLRKMIKDGLLFKSSPDGCKVCGSQPDFKAEYVSLIECDNDENFVTTKYVFRNLEVENYTRDDCVTVRYVCRLVSERAAALAAAALAGIIRHMKVDGKATIVVDGCLYQNHPCFRKNLLPFLKEMIPTEPQIVTSFSGNDKGNAIATAVGALITRR